MEHKPPEFFSVVTLSVCAVGAVDLPSVIVLVGVTYRVGRWAGLRGRSGGARRGRHVESEWRTPRRRGRVQLHDAHLPETAPAQH